jgi:hypothetical protein
MVMLKPYPAAAYIVKVNFGGLAPQPEFPWQQYDDD